MKLIVVERTLEAPVTLEQLQKNGAAGRACLDAHHVRYLRSLVSLDGLRVLCEYEAPDAESVRQANKKLGLPFDRVWAAQSGEPA
jgi:hypothetical protein